jgi:hypothetical protein
MTDFKHKLSEIAPLRGRRGGKPTRLGMELLEPRCMLSVNVTTWHNDLTHQGLNSNETILTPANVNTNTFGKLFSYSVTGQVYAQPLYASNLNMGALGTHNVVFVATENNDVYAFDAVNNGVGGGLLWHVNLGLAAQTPNIYFGNTGWDGVNPPNGNYGDLTPQVGITSTPVIDLATNTMYIDSFTNDAVGQYSHHIWALDIRTGVQTMAPKLVAASVQGTSPADSVGGVITFNAKQQLQRAAMTLLNGVVYVAYAGYGDFPPYHGWILGFDASNLNLVKVFNDTPNLATPEDTREQGAGGIWQAGGGLVSDGTHLYLMTGNGDFDAAAGDYGDSFLELTPDNSTQPTNKNGYGLSVTDYFTPFDEDTLSLNDTDLGSAAPLLLPDQAGAHPHELVGAGKGRVMYVLDRDNMGGHNNSNNNNALQTLSVRRAPGSMAFFNGLIYFHGYDTAALQAYQVSNGVVSAAAVGTGGAIYTFPGATPSISSYGSVNGIVWELENTRDFATNTVSNGVLRAYDAVPASANINELYNSGTALGPGAKFTVPTVADGHVYVGTGGTIVVNPGGSKTTSAELAVFGLTSNPIAVPAAPTNLTSTISALQGLHVKLNWTDNANSESAFRIERSTDGVNYSPLAIAAVNSTSYSDTTVVPGTTYYYRVSATNPIGDSSAISIGPVGPDFTQLYNFDEGASTFAADSGSTGANTGVLVGTTKPVWVSGRIGSGALSFSGTGAFNQTKQSAVQVTTNLFNPLGKTSTLTAWVKTTQTGNNNHQQAPAITGVDQQGTTGDINWGTLNASGRIGIFVGDTGGVYSTNPINDGTWHNVAMTRDSKTGVVQLYIDGVLNGSSTLDTGLKAAQFYLIGALTDRNSSGNVTGANYFNGQLDDIRIYNRVLSAAEIAQIGSAPAAPLDLSASPIPDSSSMMELTWTNTSEVAENISVERKAGAGGAYQQIATLAGTETRYFDTHLDEGTEYYYRVQASDSAGASEYSNEAAASTLMPQVVGRFVFYNQSNFDGSNGSSNIVDTPAVATDKQALLPGQTATFQNYTSFSKGINGIMIDVANYEGSLTPNDVSVLVGNSSDISTWQPAPELDFTTAFVGWGVNGSIRLEIGWENYTIQNQWVQVTFKANENTGLAADDVFYFGNAVGETGNSPTDAIVNEADVLAVHNHYTASATITNPYDFNRDKKVDATDESIAQSYVSGSPLVLITAPGGPGSDAPLGQMNTVSDAVATTSSDTASGPINVLVVNSSLTKPAAASVSPLIAFDSQPAHRHAADAAFDHFEPHSSRSDVMSRLLNLESFGRLNSQTRPTGTGDDASHQTHSSCDNLEIATDELMAGDFVSRIGAKLKSLARRR